MVSFFVLAVVSPLYSLDPDKSIAQYGHSIWLTLNGLPANEVNVSLQSMDGYLWFGTSAGLFRFDGVNFDSVSTEPGHEPSGSITALLESQDGGLWVGTKWTGFRHLSNKVTRYSLKEGFHNTQINALAKSKQNQLLIGTSIGLYMRDGTDFIPLLLTPNYITALATDDLGRIWAGTHQGVVVLDPSGQKTVFTVTIGDGLPNNVITCLYKDHDSIIWIGTGSGLACWQDGRITKQNELGNHINSICKDSDHNLWVGTRKGLYRMTENGTWSHFAYRHGLTNNNVLAITEDREKSLWICTSDGLNQFKDVNLTTYTTYDGLDDNYISSIIESPDSSIYFFSAQGASITKLENGRTTIYHLPVGPVYTARDSSIWIGQSGSLVKLKNGQITRYSAKDGLPPKWISAITEDDKSLLVYFDHVGLRRFIEGQIEPFLMADGKQYSNREYMTCLYPHPDGSLWIGMADSLVHIKNGVSEHFTTQDGLANNWTSSIYHDRQGVLWLSSPQGGLTRYQNGEFTAFSYKDGLFANEIYCVLGDNRGGLYLTSPLGIGYVKKANLSAYAENKVDSIHCKVYGISDGMKTEDCFGEWQPAGCKCQDGSLWFATKKGAVKIDPACFQTNNVVPPVLIQKIVADDKSCHPDSTLLFPPGTRKFEFHYTALSYKAPQDVQFKYKIEGYDQDWVNAGTRRAAFYTNLPPGTYSFQVIACNNDGVWNTQGDKIHFKLQPHFYQTLVFYILLLMVIIGLVYSVYRWRVHRHLEQERILNERIKEAVANIKTLSGLIPICSSCKKIRHDDGYWQQLESYIQSHSELQFSHGICPECMKKLYPDYHESDTDE